MPSLLGSRSRINRWCDPDRGQPRAARPPPVSALIAAGVAAGIAPLLCAAAATARRLPRAVAASAQVYRAPFGGYPRYDDAGGSVPPTPSYPPGPPWVLTAVSASGQMDEPSTRDAWSYVVFLENSAGAPSAVSNKTAPTTN